MRTLELTRAQARRGLTRLHFGKKTDVLETVQRLHSVQYDPLNVVGRNPDLVLQSRVRGYRPEKLYRELYHRHILLEGFDKMLCLFPVEDFPYFARTRRTTARAYRENPDVVQTEARLLEEIRVRGPLCSDDVVMDARVRWPWGETHAARAGLESLWMAGRLVLDHREGARRYYDLAERHIAPEILSAFDPNPTDEMYFRWQVMRRAESIGLLREAAGDAFLGVDGFKAAQRACAFESLLREGRLLRVAIEGKGYLIPSAFEAYFVENVSSPKGVRILAPLDNLLWDRRMISEIFGFDYRWEVYVPKEKRRYGYYVLPVMDGNRFIARFEPEAFRGGRLKIREWWWEDGVKPTPALLRRVDACLEKFCAYLGAEGYEEFSL